MGIVVMACLMGNRPLHLNISTSKVLLPCIVVALFNALFHLFFLLIKRRDIPLDSKSVTAWTYGQAVMDWAFISLIFHYTGGVASPFLFCLLFHVIISSVLLESRRHLVFITVIWNGQVIYPIIMGPPLYLLIYRGILILFSFCSSFSIQCFTFQVPFYRDCSDTCGRGCPNLWGFKKT